MIERISINSTVIINQFLGLISHEYNYCIRFVPRLSHISVIRAGVTLRGRDATRSVADGTFHLIRIGDIGNDGHIAGSSVVQISPREPINPEQFLRVGDVLVAARGSRNTAAVYELDLQNPIAGSQFFILRPHQNVDGRYLAWFLRSQAMQRHFDSRRKGSYVQIIQVSDLAEIEVPVPALAQQRRLVEIATLAEEERRLSNRLTDLRARYLDHILSQRAHSFPNPFDRQSTLPS